MSGSPAICMNTRKAATPCTAIRSRPRVRRGLEARFHISWAVPSQASRAAVPVYASSSSNDKHVGKATTTAFSPLLKKLIALASVSAEYSKPGTKLQMELTIEAQRMKTTATVVSLPFFNPKRKTAVPV